MKMLMYGLTTNGIKDPNNKLHLLFNKPIKYGGGEIVLLQNHYIATTVYAFEFDGINYEGIKKYTIDVYKYFEPDEIMGVIHENSCNFLISRDGVKKNDYIAFLMIQRVDGDKYVENRYLRRLFIHLADRINVEGGIQNKEVKIVYVNINNDLYNVTEEINDKIEKYNIGSGFIVCTSEERNEITKEIDDEDFMFFYLGFAEGEECQKNSNMLESSYFKVIINYLRNGYSNSKILLIGSDDIFGLSSFALLSTELSQNGFTLVDSEGPILKEQSNAYLDNIIEIYISTLGNNDVIIITASEDYQIPLFKRLADKNLINTPKNNIFISLTLNEIIAEKIGISNLENVMFPTHFFDGYTTNNTDLIEFKDYLEEAEGLVIPLTNRMGILYNSFMVLSSIIKFVVYEKPSKYKSFLYRYPVDNPIAGVYKVSYNGYGICLARLARINSTGDSELVLEDSFNRIDNIFHNDSLICDLRDNDNNGTRMRNFYYVATLFNLKSQNANQRIDDMILAIDLINQDGGIKDKDLVLLKTKYLGDVSKISEVYESQIKKYSNILCFIGADSVEEKDAVDRISSEYEVPIFSIKPGVGEHSYKSILQMASVSYQTVEIPLYWALGNKDFDYIGIIYEESDLNKNRVEYLTKMIKEYFKKDLVFNEKITTPYNDFIQNKIIPKLRNKMCILSFLDANTVKFTEKYDSLVDSAKYPLVLFDISFYDINRIEFINHYIFLNYGPELLTVENLDLLSDIVKYKGYEKLAKDEFINIYDSLLFITKAYNRILSHSIVEKSVTIQDVRQMMYNIEVKCPDGLKKLFHNNYVNKYIYLIQITSETEHVHFMDVSFPVIPDPYNFLMNNYKHKTIDYAYRNTEVYDDDPIKIVYFLDLDNNGFDNYIVSKSVIDQTNYNGGINGKRIVSELYQCPTTESEANKTVRDLYNRNFTVIIGGCDKTTRKALIPIITELNMLLFYTGNNEGLECSRNIIYMSTSPSQEIIPYLLHLFRREQKDFVYIHGHEENNKVRDKLIRSVFEGFGVKLIPTIGLDFVNRTIEQVQIDIKMVLGVIEFLYPNGCAILTLMSNDNINIFLKAFYEHFSRFGKSKDVAKIYTLYLIDDTNSVYDPNYAEGHFVYSSNIFDHESEMNMRYVNVFKDYTYGKLPSNADLLLFDSTGLVLQIFRSLYNDIHNQTALLKQLYLISLLSASGNLSISEGNSVYQKLYFGQINKNGTIDLIDRVTEKFVGETYRTSLNRDDYVICDWKDRMVDNYSEDFVRIGIIISTDINYIEDSVLLYLSVYAECLFYNQNYGGIKGKPINLVAINDGGGSETNAYLKIKEYTQKYNITFYIGGFTRSVRDGLNKAANEFNLIFFYPKDYEDEECKFNGFYGGIGFNSYFCLPAVIKQQSSGKSLIILYSETVHSVYYVEQLLKELSVLGVMTELLLKIVLGNSDFDNVAKKIYHFAPNGVYIVSLLQGKAKSYLLQSLYNNNMLPPKFVTMSINMDDQSMKKLKEASSGHYYWDTYEIDESYKTFEEVKLNFYLLCPYIGDIDRLSIRGIVLTKLLINACNTANELVYKEVRQNLYNPAETVFGTLQFTDNNRLPSTVILKHAIYHEINDDYNYTIEYQYNGRFNPKVYGNVLIYANEVKQCVLHNTKIINTYDRVTIALIFSTTGSLKEVHEKALLGALTALEETYYTTFHINNASVLARVVNYDSNLDTLKEQLTVLSEYDSIVAYVGCTDLKCKEAVENVTNVIKKPFYYPKITLGEECSYNTFFTSMVTNQYVTKLFDFYLSSIYNRNYYIITENNTVLNALKEMIYTQAGGLFREVGSFVYENDNSINVNLLNDIFYNMPDGGIIMVVLFDIDILQQFLNLYSSMSFDSNKFAVVDLLLEIEELERIPESSRKGLYHLTKYSYDIDSEDNEYFLTKTINYVNERKPTSLFESSYLAVQMFIKAAMIDDSFDTENIIRNSIDLTYQSGSGYITMNSNHYVTAGVFIVRFDVNDGKTYRTIKSYFSQISPLAYNWVLNSNFGYICTFPDNSINGVKYKIPMKRICVIGKFSNNLDVVSYVTVFEAMINEINTETIGGYHVGVNFFDSTKCSDLIDRFILYGKPIALFSFSDNEECLKRLYNDAMQVDEMLFFQLVEQSALVCEDYAYFSLDHFTFYTPVLDVIQSRLYDEILIITNENNTIAKLSYEYLIKNYGIIHSKYILEYNENTISQNILDYLYSFNSKICILFYGTTSGYKLLIETMESESLTEPKYHVIIMDPSSEIDSIPFHDYERVLYYKPIESNYQFYHLKGMLNDELGILPFVNDVAVRLYTTINIWKSAINSLPKNVLLKSTKVANLSRTDVIKAITNTQVITVEGLTEFGDNHYLSRYLNILFHDDQHKLVLNFDGDYVSKVHVYYSEELNGVIKMCDLSNQRVDGVYLKTQTIAIVLSMTGPDSLKERSLFEAIHLGIEYINQNGLLLDHYILYKLYNAASSDDHYISILNSLKNEKYKYIFAGFKTSTLEKIGDIFDNTDKKLFFLGRSLGDCYSSNTIISHLHPSQIAQAVIYRLLSLSFSTFIIRSSSSDFADAIQKRLTSKMTGLSLTTLGNIVLADPEKAIKIIKAAIPNGGYIVTIFTNQQDAIAFYNAMCRNDMKYPKYKIINSIFNENMKYGFKDYQCLYGSIVMDSYFESVGEKANNEVEVPSFAAGFNVAYHNHIGDLNKRITGFQVAAYDALIFWRGIVIKRNTFGIGNSSNMYHYVVNSPSGLIELDVNNYMLRTVYGGRINEYGDIMIDWLPSATLKAYVYNQYSISEIGYFCDWTDLKNKGKKYYTNPLKIVFVHENDYGGKTDRYSQLLADIIIVNINKAGGILGRRIVANHFWTTSSKILQTIRTVLEITKSEIIFGCVTENCADAVSTYLYGRPELFFYTGRDDGLISQRNTFISCTSFNQKVNVLNKYLRLLSYKYAILIGDRRNVTETDKYILEESFKESNITLLYTIATSVVDVVYLNNLIDSMNLKLKEYVHEKVAIIDIFPTGENEVFLTAFSKNKQLVNATRLFIMNYDPADISSNVLSSLDGEYVLTSYSITKTSTMSNAFYYLMNSNFPNLNEVSELNENVYSSIYQWKSSVEYSKEYSDEEWPNKNYIELSLKMIKYEGPSGSIKIESNNRASKNVFLYRINNNHLIQEYPKLIKENIIEASKTYGEDDNFTKAEKLFVINDSYIIIVVIFCIINVILCIIVASIVIYKRKSRIVKNENFSFLCYSIVSLLILSVVGIIYVIPPDNKLVCAIRVWFLSLSIDLIFSIMFSKAWRINKLFNNKKLEKIKISNMLLLRIIGLILLIEMMYLSLWWIIQPSVPVLTYTPNHSNYLEDIYFRQCSTSIAFVIIEFILKFIMFGYGVKLGWGLRTASAEYNDSTSILSIICVMTMFGIILIPLDFMLSNEAESVMFTRSFGIELGVLLLLLLQFGSKIMNMIKGKYYSSSETNSASGSGYLSSSSQNNTVRKKSLASRGRFEVYPCLVDLPPIVVASISEADRYFEEKVNKKSTKLYGRKNTVCSNQSTNSRASNYTSSSYRVGNNNKPLQVQISLANTQIVHERFSDRTSTISPIHRSNINNSTKASNLLMVHTSKMNTKV